MVEIHAYAIPMAISFRGLTLRQGVLFEGRAGWAEWSPFLEYGTAEAAIWLRAALEAADQPYPDPVRARVEVNATVPATDPETAHRLVRRSRCRTVKVKVGQPGQSLSEDLARVEAVRDALGPQGRIRVDANGAWNLDQARQAIKALSRFELEFVEQPCRTVEELARLRRQVGSSVAIAADESIRRTDDPYRVSRLEAADVAVLKVQPMGGVQACLRLATDLGIDVVVSSALETSVGLRAGIALAAALPVLNYACGLNTAGLLADDVVDDPLIAVDGFIDVREVRPNPDLMDRARAEPATGQAWQARFDQCQSYLERVANE